MKIKVEIDLSPELIEVLQKAGLLKNKKAEAVRQSFEELTASIRKRINDMLREQREADARKEAAPSAGDQYSCLAEKEGEENFIQQLYAAGWDGFTPFEQLTLLQRAVCEECCADDEVAINAINKRIQLRREEQLRKEREEGLQMQMEANIGTTL